MNEMTLGSKAAKRYLAWDIWQFWTTSKAGRKDEMFHLENSSSLSTSVDFDSPRFQVVVPLCLGDDGRSPYVELK